MTSTGYLQTVEWSFPQVLLVLGGGLVGAGIAAIGIAAFSGTEVTISAFVWTFVGQAIGSFFVLAYLSRTRGTGSFATDFGLELHLGDWWGLPAGAVLQIAAAVVTAPLIQFFFPDGPPEQEVVALTEGSETVVDAILIIIAVGLLAPVVEEIVFRGMLLSRLARSMSNRWAIVAQGAIFAGIHLVDPSAIAALPGLFLIGLVLGYAAIKRGNLSLPIYLHAGVNLTAALLLIFGGDLLARLEELSGVEPAESAISLFRLVF